MISATNPSRKNRERFAIKKSYSIENGYPSRRRSLVGDARFETQVNKEAKKSWLEEIRQVSRDSEISEDDLLFAVDDDAVFSTSGHDADINLPKVLAEIAPISEVEKEEKAEESAIIISLKDEIIAFTRILKTIDNCKATITHMESRHSHEVGTKWDILVKMNIKRQNLMILVKSLRQSYSIQKVSIITPINSIKEPWYPKHISGLDLCNHLMTKYEPDLDMDHPGFSDKSYRARRKIIADIAFQFRYGENIPRVEYNAVEIATWGHVFTQLVKLLPTHACKPFRDIFAVLQREVGYRADNIPQLQDVSDFLKKRTGFSLRPAAGLLTARDFLSSLAFRVFQCTQYVRHGSAPDHSPEPDCIHELLGHVPMLADPLFAQFSQELGLYSLGVSDEEIEKISTLYWFTVEFGLCKENGIVKAYGAGLLSSYGELEHSLSDKPEHRVFIPDLAAVQPYQDQDYQDVYYVAESFEDVKNKFRQWVLENLSSRKYEIRYNAFTETINALDSVDKLDECLAQIRIEMTYLANAIGLLKFR